MIALFGWGDKKLGETEIIPELCCPSCQQKKLRVKVVLEIIHLFFIPTASTTKTASIYCSHCLFEETEPKVRNEFMTYIDRALEQHKRPWWTFIGAFLFGSLVMYSILYGLIVGNPSHQFDSSSDNDPQNNLAEVFLKKEAEKAGSDVRGTVEQNTRYYYKESDTVYTSGIVYSADEDSVYLMRNTNSCSDSGGLKDQKFYDFLNFEAGRVKSFCVRDVERLKQEKVIIEIKH